MPTGYTYAVVEGKIKDFKSFAWGCARAFMGHSRDHHEGEGERYKRPKDKYLKGDPYSSLEYYRTSLEHSKAEHQANLNRTDDEWKVYAKTRLNEAMESYHERLRTFNVENDRIQGMKGKVESWDPPTEKHENMKKFMLEQLEISVPHLPHEVNPEEYSWENFKNSAIKSSAWDIEFYEEKMSTYQSNSSGYLDWVDALDDSITEFSKKVD